MILPIHITAGALALVFGYIALYAAKGAALHRKAGIFFVYAMVTMSITGMLISAVEGVAPQINIPTALLTFYLVTTSLLTVRPAGSRRLDIVAMVMALAIGVSCFALAINAIASGGAGAGMAYPLVMFGGVAVAASVGDRRMVRAGSLRGSPRLARHLWRMCFALFLASIAFFPRLGRIDGFPKPLIAFPILAVLAIMFYWLWRVRGNRRTRDFVSATLRSSDITRATLDLSQG